MRKMKKAGYKVKNIPKSKKELIKKLCKKEKLYFVPVEKYLKCQKRLKKNM